ncbi:MAG: Xaa-Pro aminopeptidase [Candidatus Pelagibacter sp. TMED203]|nr:MAG: Xaa-Pro aminopeptidase [Candidatus Pelagibacter sp. TMED203]
MKKVKKLLSDHKIDGYIIPKNDEHFNEYIDPSKDRLRYISKFSGSAGFAIIFKNKNYLFVDGRYTLQADLQSGKRFDVLTLPNKYPGSIIKKKYTIGFDPKLHTERGLNILFRKTKCTLKPIEQNLIDKIWKRKKTSHVKKFYKLKDKDVGQSSKKKLKVLSNILKKNKTDLLFVSASENIAWLLNIRGEDSEYSPIPNSYLFVDQKQNIYLFCKKGKVDKYLKKNLGNNVKLIDINHLKKFILKIKNKKIYLDSLSCSIFYKSILKKNNFIIQQQDPIYFLKSIKNKTEIANIKKAHIVDGIALTKFLIWLKNNYNKRKITEISAQEKLLQFRKKNKQFKSLSFPTISGAGPNSSIIHYKASEKSNRILKKGDLYLVDSGGQYSFGTTDVTRTLSLDNDKRKIKEIFTRVLKGHIAVSNYKLKQNSSGNKIDSEARKFLKKIKLDYPHSTGHGVGYFLNVHEGPQALSNLNKVKLKEGMVLSNEPGYYKNGEFGIRIENLVIIKKLKSRLQFEDLTLAPIDKSLIIKKLLNKQEIKWLNNYHNKVFYKLKNHMNSIELIYLKSACSNI